ncbi:MAG TPA: alginate export family protein [Pseudomonadota bacterium]|nr:alginate export family protein [Rhodanobacteraceae bacterium]MBP9153935.1 alginate export family protein [Xanthomonadales bacterium]HQW82305.1 alginate export family protein [Pseudomonadota bacterium]
MRNYRYALLPLALAAACAHADDSLSLTDALTNGKVTIDSRLRMENVSDDAITKDANALTWRNRVGYKTAPWFGFTLFAELEDVRALDESYNSTANGRTQYPTVADPEGSEWDQAGIAWEPTPGSQLVVGRQRINLDNQRFFGSVGWRQNDQTFDAAAFTQTLGKNTTARYYYLQDAHRVFGHANPNPLLAEYDIGGHLVNVAHVFGPATLTGYGYFVENEDLPLTSNRIIGARLAGTHALNEPWKLLYTAEYAQQANWRDGAHAIDADYVLFEIGAARGAYAGKFSQERLGGDGHYAFQTPFATLHAFNGWADKFSVIPVNGLIDNAVLVNGPAGKLQWAASYHQYSADHGGADYGTEWDASLSYAFKQRFTALAKIASYDADSFARDTDKFWLSLEYKY